MLIPSQVSVYRNIGPLVMFSCSFGLRFRGREFGIDCAGSWSLPSVYFLAIHLVEQNGLSLFSNKPQAFCSATLKDIRIYHEFVDRIDNSVPKVTARHHEALPSDAKQ